MQAFTRLLCGMTVLLCTSAFAGDLNPPVGPVQPTMKTLEQVEPRIDVQTLPGGGTFEFGIFAPGSYYLSDNITLTLPITAIVIFADDVTLDLNGFTINGDNVGTDGIRVDGFRSNIRIHNGVVRDFTGPGISAASTANSLYENLRTLSNAIGIQVAFGSIVRNCVDRDSSSFGILAGGGCRIIDCAVQNTSGGTGITAGPGSVISGCTASACNTGIRVEGRCQLRDSSATSCAINAFWIFGDQSRVEGCHAASSTTGYLSQGSSSILVQNTAASCITPYDLSGDTRYGTIINISGGPSEITSTNPWANFIH